MAIVHAPIGKTFKGNFLPDRIVLIDVHEKPVCSAVIRVRLFVFSGLVDVVGHSSILLSTSLANNTIGTAGSKRGGCFPSD